MAVHQRLEVGTVQGAGQHFSDGQARSGVQVVRWRHVLVASTFVVAAAGAAAAGAAAAAAAAAAATGSTDDRMEKRRGRRAVFVVPTAVAPRKSTRNDIVHRNGAHTREVGRGRVTTAVAPIGYGYGSRTGSSRSSGHEDGERRAPAARECDRRRLDVGVGVGVGVGRALLTNVRVRRVVLSC